MEIWVISQWVPAFCQWERAYMLMINQPKKTRNKYNTSPFLLHFLVLNKYKSIYTAFWNTWFWLVKHSILSNILY